MWDRGAGLSERANLVRSLKWAQFYQNVRSIKWVGGETQCCGGRFLAAVVCEMYTQKFSKSELLCAEQIGSGMDLYFSLVYTATSTDTVRPCSRRTPLSFIMFVRTISFWVLVLAHFQQVVTGSFLEPASQGHIWASLNIFELDQVKNCCRTFSSAGGPPGGQQLLLQARIPNEDLAPTTSYDQKLLPSAEIGRKCDVIQAELSSLGSAFRVFASSWTALRRFELDNLDMRGNVLVDRDPAGDLADRQLPLLAASQKHFRELDVLRKNLAAIGAQAAEAGNSCVLLKIAKTWLGSLPQLDQIYTSHGLVAPGQWDLRLTSSARYQNPWQAAITPAGRWSSVELKMDQGQAPLWAVVHSVAELGLLWETNAQREENPVISELINVLKTSLGSGPPLRSFLGLQALIFIARPLLGVRDSTSPTRFPLDYVAISASSQKELQTRSASAVLKGLADFLVEGMDDPVFLTEKFCEFSLYILFREIPGIVYQLDHAPTEVRLLLPAAESLVDIYSLWYVRIYMPLVEPSSSSLSKQDFAFAKNFYPFSSSLRAIPHDLWITFRVFRHAIFSTANLSPLAGLLGKRLRHLKNSEEGPEDEQDPKREVRTHEKDEVIETLRRVDVAISAAESSSSTSRAPSAWSNTSNKLLTRICCRRRMFLATTTNPC